MSERFQVNGERSADEIFWWIHDSFVKMNGKKYWSVVPTNPIRVDVCTRGELPSSVEIVTANIFDWVCQDDEGNFYVETSEGTRKEPIKRVIPEPTYTQAQVEQLRDAIAVRVKDYFAEGEAIDNCATDEELNNYTYIVEIADFIRSTKI